MKKILFFTIIAAIVLTSCTRYEYVSGDKIGCKFPVAKPSKPRNVNNKPFKNW